MKLQELERTLFEHPLYSEVSSLEDLKVFMSYHVICVFDFMSLVQLLREELGRRRADKVWLPPESTEVVRFINEIMLDEESDDLGEGRILSHFELYLEAMAEVNVDVDPVLDLVSELSRGTPPEVAVRCSRLPEAAKAFHLSTLGVLEEPTQVVLAVFCRSRESVIPEMFRRIVSTLEDEKLPCAGLKLYLQRHIDVDDDKHGPMADRLMKAYCQTDAQTILRCQSAAEKAIGARIALWDSCLEAIYAGRARRLSQPRVGAPVKGL